LKFLFVEVGDETAQRIGHRNRNQDQRRVDAQVSLTVRDTFRVGRVFALAARRYLDVGVGLACSLRLLARLLVFVVRCKRQGRGERCNSECE
jgi:hypothetical protein